MISIVIPVFNLSGELTKCLSSLSCQTLSKSLYEVVIVDDCSTDDTFQIARSYSDKERHVRCYRLNKNGGPGIARNRGINEARGDFIFFLDGDDFLPTYALDTLNKIASQKQADAITFNWAYSEDGEDSGNWEPQRKDLNRFSDSKAELIKRFLSMTFDGSVIYTMTRKTLLDENHIRFPGGLHEDISVIFKIYYHATRLHREDRVLYLKRNRAGSIVNTISRAHIDGYFSSWAIINKFLSDVEGGIFVEKHMPDYMKGVAGLIAVSLLKNMNINDADPDFRNEIYSCIYELIRVYFSSNSVS